MSCRYQDIGFSLMLIFFASCSACDHSNRAIEKIDKLEKKLDNLRIHQCVDK